jgi:hypothetical protein
VCSYLDFGDWYLIHVRIGHLVGYWFSKSVSLTERIRQSNSRAASDTAIKSGFGTNLVAKSHQETGSGFGSSKYEENKADEHL